MNTTKQVPGKMTAVKKASAKKIVKKQTPKKNAAPKKQIAIVEQEAEIDQLDFSFFNNSLVMDIEEFTAFIAEHKKVCIVTSWQIDEKDDKGLGVGVDLYVFNYEEIIRSKYPGQKLETHTKTTFFVCYTVPNTTDYRIFEASTYEASKDVFYSLDEKYHYEKSQIAAEFTKSFNP